LRLLRNADGLQEGAIGQFFGFGPDETRFVVDHAESFGYVARVGGRACLTEAGHSLFSVSGDEPTLFEVSAKREHFDFDLIALAPAERRPLTQFEYNLPELDLADVEEMANASQRLVPSFKRHFQEFRFKRGGSRLEKQSLYTVDDVQPEKRFPEIVPVTVSVRSDHPAFPEANLLSWKTGFELEDRAAVVRGCASFVRAIRIPASALSQQATDCLALCAPDQVSRFIRNDVFSAEAFFRWTVRQVGELRRDRPTVRTIGNLWTDANRTRFASALTTAVERGGTPPSMMFWLRPALPLWGTTTRLSDIIEAVKNQLAPGEGDERQSVRAVMLGDEEPPKRFRSLFNAVLAVPSRRLPQGLELLLVPGRLTFVLVHTPIGIAEGYPIPLGIASVDPKVIERVHGLITDVIAAAQPVPLHCDWNTANLMDEIDAALDFSTEGTT